MSFRKACTKKWQTDAPKKTQDMSEAITAFFGLQFWGHECREDSP